MRPKNIKEAKKLVMNYESITEDLIIEKMKGKEFNAKEVANILTGFGSEKTCTLCKAVGFCIYCIYGKFGGCVEMYAVVYRTDERFKGRLRRTYMAIEKSKSPKELINAFRERAKLLRELLKIGYGIEVKYERNKI